jgi:tRNA (guanine37-N1)-methyltransferase
MKILDKLASLIPHDKLRDFSGRFDVIGDIAIVVLPPHLKKYDHIIANAILEHRHGIRIVVNKNSDVAGKFRTAHYAVIVGNGTVTTHHEFGFSYSFDLNSSFFNPRLAQERRRVTSQVEAGEQVLVPFCGVGPFVIPAAAHGATVVAIEQNPDAFHWFEENIRENKVIGKVAGIRGDAFNPEILTVGPFDRAIIPTPYSKDHILDLIAPRVKSGGLIHFYTFKNRAQSETMENEFVKRGYCVLTRRRCGNVAPSVSRWVFDLQVP